MIQELKLDPVKLHQHFGMSVGEFKGSDSSTGTTYTKEREHFWCDVIGYLALFWLVSGPGFLFSSANILTLEWKNNCSFFVPNILC